MNSSSTACYFFPKFCLHIAHVFLFSINHILNFRLVLWLLSVHGQLYLAQQIPKDIMILTYVMFYRLVFSFLFEPLQVDNLISTSWYYSSYPINVYCSQWKILMYIQIQDYFKWFWLTHHIHQRKSALSVNTTLSGPLISRFDIVLVLLDTKNPEWDAIVSSHILAEVPTTLSLY